MMQALWAASCGTTFAALAGATMLASCRATPSSPKETSAVAAPAAALPAVDKVAYYQRRIAEHPRHYTAYAQLAMAHLEQAKRTHDPTQLAEARSAAQRSLAIQQNLPAFQAMAAICNFAHQFEDALAWTAKAAAAAPDDPSVKAQVVEASLGLGRIDVARQIVSQLENPPADFHAAAMFALVQRASAQVDEAVQSYLAAAEFADRQDSLEHSVWARVCAAGVLLDAGRASEARGYLDDAARLSPHDPFLQMHWAEWHVAMGELPEALAIYESLLKHSDDPALHVQAFELARQLQMPARARQHYRAAEAGFQRAIDAGETYTVAPLAKLREAAASPPP